MGSVIISPGILSMLSVIAFATPQEQAATPDAAQQVVLNLAKQVRKQIITQSGVFSVDNDLQVASKAATQTG